MSDVPGVLRAAVHSEAVDALSHSNNEEDYLYIILGA